VNEQLTIPNLGPVDPDDRRAVVTEADRIDAREAMEAMLEDVAAVSEQAPSDRDLLNLQTMLPVAVAVLVKIALIRKHMHEGDPIRQINAVKQPLFAPYASFEATLEARGAEGAKVLHPDGGFVSPAAA
jgi:hypothetical protein